MALRDRDGRHQEQRINRLFDLYESLKKLIVDKISTKQDNILKKDDDGLLYVSCYDSKVYYQKNFNGNGSQDSPLSISISTKPHNALKEEEDGSLYVDTFASNLIYVDNNYVTKNLDVVAVNTSGAKLSKDEYHCTIALQQAKMTGESVIIFDAASNAQNRPIRVTATNSTINGYNEFWIDRNNIKVEFKFLDYNWVAIF